MILRRNHERGSALLIALMVILSLAALGMLAVYQANYELHAAGNQRIAKQGYFLAEAGLAAPVAAAAMDQNVFLSFLQTNSFVVRMNDIYTDFYGFDHDLDTPPNVELGAFGPEFSDYDNAFWITYFSDPMDTKRVPGFSMAGFCYRKYTMTADGLLGMNNIDPEDHPDSVGHTTQRRFISHIYLGPFPCGL